MSNHDLLSLRDVAQLAGVEEQTIRAYLYRGKMPEPDIRLGGRPGWNRHTVEQWVAGRRQRRKAHRA